MRHIIATAGRALRTRRAPSTSMPSQAVEASRVALSVRRSATILPLHPGIEPDSARRRRSKREDSDDGSPARILVIDDNATVLEVFRRILEGDARVRSADLDQLEAAVFATATAPKAEQPRFAVDVICDGKEGRDRARTALNEGRPYAVAFVDMRMPGGWDGLKTIEELWRVDRDLQVVICTAYSDYSWDDINARLGISDRLLILRKPFDKIEVLQLACALSHKWRMHREQQARLDDLELRVQERTRHLQVALDERKACETQLHFQASHDALTGLPNRNLLEDRVAQAIAQAHRTDRKISLLSLDLDRFQFINDSFGHTVGDALLKAVAARLQEVVRASDTVARLGGDEFVIVLADLAQAELAASVAQKVRSAFAHPFVMQGQTLYVTSSIGISVYPEDGDTSEILLKNADAAMYRAKEQGPDGFQFYTQDMGARVRSA